MSKKNYSWIDLLPVTLVTTLFVLQIILGTFLLSNIVQIKVLAFVGAGLYTFTGLIFGWLPVIEFRKKGGVEEEKSYIHTTHLVDTGIYSIVRHPQYVTFMMWSVAGMMLFQHWIIILIGLPILPLTYIDLIRADRDAIRKFGDDYLAYMKKVPRANFLLGIIRRYKKTE